MIPDKTSSRRRFLKSGAILAAPLAAASAPAVALAGEGLAGGEPDGEAAKARIKRLEDEAAIRELQHSWLRRINTGVRDPLLDDAVRRITSDHAGAPDSIEIVADGRRALGRFDYVVEVETPLATGGTLAQMAHVQGTGTLRRSERRRLTVGYAMAGGRWEIASVAMAAL